MKTIVKMSVTMVMVIICLNLNEILLGEYHRYRYQYPHYTCIPVVDKKRIHNYW